MTKTEKKQAVEEAKEKVESAKVEVGRAWVALEHAGYDLADTEQCLDEMEAESLACMIRKEKEQ